MYKSKIWWSIVETHYIFYKRHMTPNNDLIYLKMFKLQINQRLRHCSRFLIGDREHLGPFNKVIRENQDVTIACVNYEKRTCYIHR